MISTFVGLKASEFYSRKKKKFFYFENDLRIWQTVKFSIYLSFIFSPFLRIVQRIRASRIYPRCWFCHLSHLCSIYYGFIFLPAPGLAKAVWLEKHSPTYFRPFVMRASLVPFALSMNYLFHCMCFSQNS